MPLIKTKKQIEAVDVISQQTTTLLEGGARSGKTFIALHCLAVRASHYPNTWHLAARLRFNHAKISLWQKTLPDVIKALDLGKAVKFNDSDFFILFPNNSRIYVAGLDDKDRVEKILGNEFASIFLNEVSQISFDSYETVKTRLNPPKGVPPRMILDYNPPSINHWGYRLFHLRQKPDGSLVPNDDYKVFRMNPQDNVENISETFIKGLEELSGNKRKRFLLGEYTTEEGSLWKRSWIKYRKAPDNLQRVAIGVDPSGSKSGDEIGNIAAGMDAEGNYYVLGDYSLHGTPNEWGGEVAAAYKTHNADVVAAEKNYGGEMVEATITQFGQININVKLVNATRGKVVRAEPVAALYEKGLVYHTREFTELENELCTTRFDDLKSSPNRLDALVWAITELADSNQNLRVRVI